MKTGQIILASIAGLVGIGLMFYGANNKFKIWVDAMFAGRKHSADSWNEDDY